MDVREASATYADLSVAMVGTASADYKQTEVGLIPQDWTVAVLGSLTRRIQRGASPRPIDDPIWFDQGSDIGWVRISDVTQSGRYLVETTQFLSQGGVRRSRYLPSGSLIMSICATVGRPVETRIDVCIHDGFVVFEHPSVDQGFLYHVLKELEPRWSSKGQIGSQMNLNTGLIKSTQIPLPPTKVEQEAIAEALSDADALIESLQQLIAKKRQIKQGAMQTLLTGQQRIPGFGEEWRSCRLDSLADIRSGGTPSTGRPELWGGEIPWCTPTDITALNGSKYVRETARTITQLGLASSSAELTPANSIVMTSRATIGECAINQIPLSTNQGLKSFIPNPEIDAEFLYYLLQTKTEDFISLCGGSTFLEIGKKQLAAFEVFLPRERVEQTGIATVLSDMDVEITALETRLSKIHEIKQGMMQALLTGAVRLPLVEAS